MRNAFTNDVPDERERFEGWAREHNVCTNGNDGDYVFRDARMAWAAWQHRARIHGVSATDSWKEAVLDNLAITCGDAPIGTPPADILDQIIRWHVAVATDPAVSEEMAKQHDAVDTLTEEGWTWGGDQWQRPAGVVGINGLTEAETSATASVMGIVGVVVDHGLHSKPVVDHEAANLRDNACGVTAPCAWQEEDPNGDMPGTYESACGELWSFNEGGVKENHVRFCQGCGKPVEVVPFPEPTDEDADLGVGTKPGEPA